MQTVMRSVQVWSVLGGAALLAHPASAQSRTPRADLAVLQRLLVAEDARGTGEDGMTPLLAGMKSSDTLVRRIAVRGLGRLQRPELSKALLPLLADPVPAVRAEAANAIAQGFKRVRRGAAVTDSMQLSSAGAFAAFASGMAAERNESVVGAIAEAMGRLPFADSTEARAAERVMLAHLGERPSWGVVHGLYSLAQTRRFSGGLSGDGIVRLRQVAVGTSSAEVRRLATLALGLVGGLDDATTRVVAADRDEQVRRLALAGAASLSGSEREALAVRALADASPIVRVAAVGAIRALGRPPECGRLIPVAQRDAHPWVRLIAIDSLGAPCADSAAARTALVAIVTATRSGLPAHSWQAPARALEALSRVDTARARPHLARYLSSPRWNERVVAGSVAARLGDESALLRLSRDADQNVREAAIAGLSGLRKHAADSVYLAALSAPGYQVVLAAANALAGTTASGALPLLLDAFDRLSAERSENARDPRVAVLRRIGELGGAATADRLTPYLADFDTLIASSTATLLTRWKGTPVSARPDPLPIHPEPLAQLLLGPEIHLRFTLSAASGGGSFVVALHTNEAPATAARLVRLARSRFYEGNVLQRVEPNFVVQGGGPGATEYIGDTTFMRDELTPRTHGRGTIGISARGRDTGDAQIYVNVVDNPLLDHEYTVAGTIISGREVSERIMEGDIIARVEVIGGPR